MFIHRNTPSYYSSRIIMFAFGISLVLHGLFVWWAPKASNSIQSGVTSRINVSTQWANINSENSIPSEVEKKIEKKQQQKQQQKPEKNLRDKTAQGDIRFEKKTKPVESELNKNTQKNVTKPQVAQVKHNVSSQSVQKQKVLAKTVAPEETLIKPKLSAVENGSDSGQAINENLLAETKHLDKGESLTQAQPLSSAANNQNEVQTIRYQMGTNDNPQPDYPPMARKRGWQGQVILGVYVKPDGSIEHLTFVKSTDHGVLNFEAYETVRTSWRFKPLGDKDKFSKSSYIEVPFTFNIANR